MHRSWIKSRMFSREHIEGVEEFMTFVSQRLSDGEEMVCSCRRCLNRVRKPKVQVEGHLYIHGMSSTYTRWVHHGEPLEVVPHDEIDDHVDEHSSLNEDFGMSVDEEDDPDDGIHCMVEELYTAEEEGKGKESMFAILLEEMKQELHPSDPCTRFSFVVKLLHIKSFYRISNVAFTTFLKVLSSTFPNCSIPATYEEPKRLIPALGLGYNSICVCPNNYVLFRKNLEKNDVCPVFGASR